MKVMRSMSRAQERRWNGLFVLLLFTGTLSLRAEAADTNAPGDAILGIWHTTEDKSQVQVFKEDDKYFAKIVSLKEPAWPEGDKEGMAGKPKNDRRNPSPKLRSRPIAGLLFMNDFLYSGRNLWSGGRVYDPECGKTYKCKMSLIATNRLEVHGYVGVSLLGRTVVWTR
jgi:uncharacterized protein (DUF2147 family)